MEDWKKYTQEYFSKLGIISGDTIFDVGCGSGAFVYPLYLQTHRVGGVDFSMSLINLAKVIMPSSNYICDEAVNIDTSAYDFVISHSVFHYFKDLDYARDVLIKMIKKANKQIGIFDINDKSKEEKHHEVRMDCMGEDEYREKYNGLEHLFFDKSWFEQIAKEFGLEVSIFDQTFENYSNSSLRFNVIMKKL